MARADSGARPERRTHGHQHLAGPDKRGDRLAVPGAHPVLVVRPERPRPHRHRPRRGHLPLHARRQADHRLQRPADVRQHRPRRPPRDRRHARAGAQAAVRPAGVRDRDPRPPRCQARRDPAGRHEQGLLHPRRRRGDRERHQARPPLHRPLQGPRPLPRLPRRHLRGDDPHRRPAPLGQRARASSASSATRTPTAGARPSRVPSRSRCRASRTSSATRGRARSPRSSSRPSSGRTAS